MATISSIDLVNTIRQLNFNPTEVMRLQLKAIQQTLNGEVSFFDASNPMINTMEAGILTSTAVLQEIGTITRRLYSPAVDSWEDLYLHMQGIDYQEMVDQPGMATLNLIFSLEELKNKAIVLDSNPDIKVIEIPAHTQITVGDYTLMMKFGVMIRINRYGNVSIRYLLDDDAVLGRVSNSLIVHSYINYNNIEAITFPVECVQVALSSRAISVSPTTGFKEKIKISDKFYKLRAFIKVNDDWVEIDVTRRLRTLNRNKVTVQIKVLDGQVEIMVPSFYFNNMMVGNSIRIDIYTTKGDITHPLVNYNEAAYKLNYYDYNNKANAYAGRLGTFSIIRCYSTDVIEGGRSALTFNQMKDRVVNRSSISEGLPITELEINNRLNDLGFSCLKVLDNIADRTYAASKLIPPPDDNLTVTGVGCNVQTYQDSFENLAKLSSVRDHGNRLTVLPHTLYNVVNGVLTVVDSELVARMINSNITSPESTATWANNNQLVFTPYYYVHDINDNQYSVRAYRLDNPTISRKLTINDNPTLQLDAGVMIYQLQARSDLSGYSLYLGLGVGSSFKQIDIRDISLQISYTDASGENRYYINGVLHTGIDSTTGRPLGDNYIYRFDFLTGWDIDEDHNLILSDSFLPVPLECDMDVFIIVKGFTPTGFKPTAMDNIINLPSLSNYDGSSSQVALIQERLSIKFGAFMSNLWNRCRTAIDAADYQRYTDDVTAKYTEVVYKRLNKVIETAYNPDTDKIEPVILHNIGDDVIDANGEVVYKHRAGDIVKQNGLPVYKEGLRGLKRQFDIVVMDGLYFLTTQDSSINYIKNVLNVIDDWVFNVLKDEVTPELLQRTQVLYHPKSTVGQIEVYVENGIRTMVSSDQQFHIRFFVDGSVIDNTDLQRALEKTSKIALQNILQSRNTISVIDLTDALKEALGENVLGIELNGFMKGLYNTVTVANSLTTPSIGKRLVVNSKLELVVEDAVEFDWVWHTRRD